VAFVLVGAADATLLPFIPLYLFERGFSAAAIGIVLAASALASFVAGPAWAYLADHRLGLENTVVVAGSAGAAVALLLAWANTTIAVAAVMVAYWVARAPLIPLLDAIALQRLRTASRVGYARIRLRMSAGWAASVVLSGGLFQVAGLRLMPFVYAPLALLVGLWVWRVRTRGAAGQRAEPAQNPPRVGRPNPLPMALMGIAGEFAFLRSASGQTGLVKEGDSLGDMKLLRIGINRVLIELDGQNKELTIFSGYGGDSLLPTNTPNENNHP